MTHVLTQSLFAAVWYRRLRHIVCVMLVAVVLAFGQPVAALDASRQPSQLITKSWARAEGMPAEASWAIHQSADGYLWVGTEGGVLRFDGVQFDEFSRRTHDAFLADDVRSVAEGPSGTIWAATFGGGLIRIRGNEVTRFDGEHGLIHDVLYATHVSTSGDVWVGTSNGVCRLRDERFRCWDEADGLVRGRIVRMAEDASGMMWFASLVEGVSSFDGTSFVSYGEAQGMKSPQVFMLLSDPKLNVLIGTYAGDYHRVGATGLVPVSRDALPSGLVPLSAARDREGNLWVGMNGTGGLWRMRPDTQRLDDPAAGVSHVFGITEDEAGGLWAASATGLTQYRAGPFVPWGEPEGLADGTFVVAPAADGGVWIGSEGSGLYRITNAGDVSRITSEDGLPSDSVSSLMLDVDGTLWIGTFGGGLAMMRDGAIERVFDQENGMAGNQIASIYRDRNDTLWVGTAGGVNRLVNEVVTHTFTTEDGLAANLVRHIEQDSDGRLLLSSDSGLMRLSPDTLSLIDTLGREQGLPNDVVATTYVDGRGVVWIGGRSGGLARLEGESLFRFDASHELGIDSVMTIVEDHEAHLWLGGRRGVVRIAKSQLDAVARGDASTVVSRAFSENDGLRTIRIPGGFQSAAARTRDGKLWFATARGVAVVDPRNLRPSNEPLKVVIESVRADGKQIFGASPYVIPAQTKSLEVDYTVPLLNGADALEFRYRLARDGDRWQQAGKRRTAFFTSLSPRRSVFEVSATRNGQPYAAHGNNMATIEFYVEPQWFETYLSKAVAALLLMALACLLYRIAVARYRRRQKRLEQLVSERTEALSDALEKVERMSRTDVLTQVANRRHFEERLNEEWRRAVSLRQPISVMMIDIDYFKQFNDVAGHQAGDRCLKTVAQALAGCMREQDFVARYGGEEFSVLLTGVNVDATQQIARRLQESVRALGMAHPGRPDGGSVTVSAGFATAEPGVIDTAEELIRRADEALYRAKDQGRDRMVLYSDYANTG